MLPDLEKYMLTLNWDASLLLRAEAFTLAFRTNHPISLLLSCAEAPIAMPQGNSEDVEPEFSFSTLLNA